MFRTFISTAKQLLFLLICAIVLGIGSMQLTKCFTPDEYIGVCIELKQCEPLFKLRHKIPKTHEDRLFLSLSLCGYKNREPIVCCSSENSPSIPVNPAQFRTTGNSLPDPSECSAAHEERIFGGEEAKIDEFPFSALLLYEKVFSDNRITNYTFNCGGSLISHRFVLTAAHCISPSILRSSPRNYELRGVRLGEYNLQTNPDCGEGVSEDFVCAPAFIDVKIEEQIIHENFDQGRHNDIALLKLAQHIDFSNFVKPICLPFNDFFRNTDNLNFIVTGFGKTETSNFSNIKLKTNVGAVKADECQRLIISQDQSKTILSNQICALGIDNQDTCNGDSGNGLIYVNTRSTHAHWVILGITSYGPSPCGADVPGVYTRVTEFIPWIMRKMSEK